MATTAVVMGATGNVGYKLAMELLARGLTVRAIARHASALEPLDSKGAEVRRGSLDDMGFLTSAMRGADVVFAMQPPDPTTPDIRAYSTRITSTVAEAIRAARVSRVVALSSAGASLPSGTGPIAGLYDFEARLKSLHNVSLVVLRPAYFMENYLASIPMIRSSGMIANS